MTTQEDAPLLITEHGLIALIALAGTPGALNGRSLFRLDHAAGAPLEQAGMAAFVQPAPVALRPEDLEDRLRQGLGLQTA